MQTYRFDTTIPANRRVEFTVPENFPSGAAEVTVLSRNATDRSLSEQENTLDALLAWQQSLPIRPRTAEEIEAQIREERVFVQRKGK